MATQQLLSISPRKLTNWRNDAK